MKGVIKWKPVLGLIFFLFVLALLLFYWIIPWDSTEFFVENKNSNFSLDNTTDMQFYSNMRFPNPDISYHIDDCTLQKQEDMERAFDIMENLTVLSFYPVDFDEEISVTCSSENRIEEGMFVAGEGGPTNITSGGEFNVIFNGMVLLIKDSNCERPNVAIHELLHVLGFKHSANPNNIMYNFSKCKQTIGDDISNLLNELYSVPSYEDLLFEDVSVIMRGKYLDTNFTVRNYGLKDSEDFLIKIYADGKFVKDVEMNEIGIGFGRSVSLSNVLINQFNVKEIEFVIDGSFQELDKENNKITLKVKE